MNDLQEFLIALGGNQDEIPENISKTIEMALFELESSGVVISKVSRFYRTSCFPKGAGPDFVNAAAQLHFGGTADEMLRRLHAVENAFGRKRLQRWGTRSLDLDLIAAGSLVLPNSKTQKHWRDLPLDEQMRQAPEELILPHPRLQDRAFVLVPLADVAPDWVHPMTGTTVAKMLSALPQDEISDVVPL
ncbi:2-amino-4-hydroxy-6-hydroxymethyldihydropteridine diphosphokinase [Roseovarius sp. EL26]|uniref:2-amino-4-hydroxy-6- hydroxymethyldihydropteridine diphosphokinase n=1 Tax=Roseovarius sp. EL26 TaxID=2126672 RepID=UPI000EA3960D|nr:2-amino-4-hydroxy-6-hydroxymethyldihydropteridine diphosphokinase [Roseovarius sp. EL26]